MDAASVLGPNERAMQGSEAGMLRGMMIIEPQGTAMMSQHAVQHRDQIALRAGQCTDVFYNGCWQ